MTTGTEIMNRPGAVRMAGLLAGRFLPALLAVCSAALVCGGCALPTVAPVPAKEAPRQVGTTDGGKPMPIMSAELDELTRAFADRYVGLLSSACDALKKDNPDLVQRREVQELMLDCATNVYDIASNPDAFTRMLDLVVVTTLVSQVWIDDDRAWEVFGDRGEVLVRALHHGRVEAWALAAQVLRPEQLDLMDYLLWDWRRHNPDMVRVSFVRLSTFAIGRGRSANAEVLAASGLYANVGQQGQAVAEARLLGERVFYMFKREPTLLRWQVVALQDEMLATLNDRKLGLDGTLTNVRGVLTDANALVTSLDQTSHSLNEMFKTTDALLVRYDAIHSSRPFDIREYMETVKEVAVAAEKMNDLLQSSNQLLGSSEWDRRIQQVNQSADERIKIAAEQSQRVVNDLFWRVYVALGVLFAMLILLCLVAVFLVIRRPRIVAGNARDAGRKETSE
ncbi:MAG: hypothetical protein ABSH10_06270 [Phycisphaerae bacterium]|jgi:hypothetical protein